MTQSMTRRLPEIIHVGPERTGTTWLHRVLDGHVDLPYGVKETRFFTTFYDNGIDWYAHHFRYATGDRKIAEICPYFVKPEARDRIKIHIPDCRIITTMRDPVDRLYSTYKLFRHMGTARRGTFEEILDAWPSMVAGNHYAVHLKGWFETFGLENVLVTIYDELQADPQIHLNRVTDFMDVERIALSDRPKIGDDVYAFRRAPRNGKLAHRAWKVRHWLKGRQLYGMVNLLERSRVWEYCTGRGELFPRLTPEQDARLRERFMPDVEALEELLSKDLSAWKKPRAPRVVEDFPARPLQRIANQ